MIEIVTIPPSEHGGIDEPLIDAVMMYAESQIDNDLPTRVRIQREVASGKMWEVTCWGIATQPRPSLMLIGVGWGKNQRAAHVNLAAPFAEIRDKSIVRRIDLINQAFVIAVCAAWVVLCVTALVTGLRFWAIGGDIVSCICSVILGVIGGMNARQFDAQLRKYRRQHRRHAAKRKGMFSHVRNNRQPKRDVRLLLHLLRVLVARVKNVRRAGHSSDSAQS